MGLARPRPEGLRMLLTASHSSSEKLLELASRLFLVWRGET